MLYIAQFFPPREVDKCRVVFEAAGHRFVAHASQEISAGWRAVVKGDDEDDEDEKDRKTDATALAALLKDDAGMVAKAWVEDKQTQPPKRYTMATLLKDLAAVAKYVNDPRIKVLLLDKDVDKADEKGGIGTPATRDSHIETLFARGYITEQKKSIISTDLGRQLIDALPDFATTPDMTALWHEKQKEIEAGNFTLDALLAEIDQAIAGEVARVKAEGLALALDLPQCPVCNTGYLRQRSGKNGKFWGCSHYPECKATFPDKKGTPDFAVEKAEVSSEHVCPQCGKGLVRRPSKKDKKRFWWGCSGYPQCTFTAFDNHGKPKLG